MVLATGLAFFMLWFGGGGGLINMSYGMNAMVHNTSWVTAHFHLIFGGTALIMYFAIAYAIWPTLTGRMPDLLNDPNALMYRFFDSKAAARLLDEHKQGKRNHYRLLFSLVLVEEWLRSRAG